MVQGTGPIHPRLPSLRSRLARHVLLPLAVVWIVGTTITTSVAFYYAQQAFDRALLDDAFALTANVQNGPQGNQLKLTESELKALLYDQSETVYFAVQRTDGSLISGHPWLRAGPRSDTDAYAFSDTTHAGNTLRVVTVTRADGAGFRVIMAQTTRSRTELLRRLLLFSLVPQALLLLVLAAWLRRVIGTDLQPLTALQLTLNQRDAADLTPVPVTASNRDIQRLGGAVNSLLGRISAGVQAQREFTGNVAHELRTPLAGIRALTEYGLSQSDPAIWQQQLKAVATSEVRASHIVEQLLALALADETRDSLQLVPVRLNVLVRRIVLDALPRADALGIDLGARGLDSAISITGDAGLIEGALINLLDNAFRYGRPASGQPPTITVELHADAKSVSLQVTDNGPGIADGTQEELSQRWQKGNTVTTAKIGAGQGVGLGLAIVRRYADLLGAHMELVNVVETAESESGLKASLNWPTSRAPGVRVK